MKNRAEALRTSPNTISFTIRIDGKEYQDGYVTDYSNIQEVSKLIKSLKSRALCTISDYQNEKGFNYCMCGELFKLNGNPICDKCIEERS